MRFTAILYIVRFKNAIVLEKYEESMYCKGLDWIVIHACNNSQLFVTIHPTNFRQCKKTHKREPAPRKQTRKHLSYLDFIGKTFLALTVRSAATICGAQFVVSRNLQSLSGRDELVVQPVRVSSV